MEQLLFLLFVLFSVVSALLERRKRKRQLEEQRKAGTPEKAEREEEEEETWPFPMGGDPFEPVRQRRPSRPPGEEPEEERAPQPVAAEVAGEQEEPEPPSRPNIFQRLEDFAREEERRARDEEERVLAEQERARQLERRATETAGRVRERARPRSEPVEQPRVAKRKRRSKWSLTPETARDAIVYAEIFGKPKAGPGRRSCTGKQPVDKVALQARPSHGGRRQGARPRRIEGIRGGSATPDSTVRAGRSPDGLFQRADKGGPAIPWHPEQPKWRNW